jgi:hypothetical protein
MSQDNVQSRSNISSDVEQISYENVYALARYAIMVLQEIVQNQVASAAKRKTIP